MIINNNTYFVQLLQEPHEMAFIDSLHSTWLGGHQINISWSEWWLSSVIYWNPVKIHMEQSMAEKLFAGSDLFIYFNMIFI